MSLWRRSGIMTKANATFIAIKAAVKSAIAEVGYGHREAVYQRALTAELMRRRVASMTEVLIPFFTHGVCVGVGRVDILTDSHVIEMKSAPMTRTLLTRGQQQTRKYLVAMRKVHACNRQRRGVLIVIDSVAQKLYIRQV